MYRIGQQLGNYLLTRFLGRGGYAEVYLGKHIYLQIPAAIKLLHVAPSTSDWQPFLHEAQTIAKLHHPNIIRVIDFGVDTSSNLPYLIIEYAPYGTLLNLHPEGHIVPLPTVVSHVKEIAAALQFAHTHKLIHRDVKPANILLARDNTLLLSDFGLATIAHETSSLETLDPAGTPRYIAPEQLEGKPRPASDQYALGIMVYEWLCGRPPFLGKTAELMHQHLHVPPPPLREHSEQVTDDIERVVMQALAKDPHDRFATVEKFAETLEQACFPDRAVPVDAEAEKTEESSSDEQDTPPPPRRALPTRMTIFDIGTTSVRAAIVDLSKNEIRVLGMGRHEQPRSAMSQSNIADISQVVESAGKALAKARQSAGGIVAPQAAVLMNGGMVRGTTVTQRIQRQYPLQPISTAEWEDLFAKAFGSLVKLIEGQYLSLLHHLRRVEFRLIDIDTLAINVDNQRISNPLGFHGSDVDLTLFATFAPLTQRGAMEAVMDGLGMQLKHVTSAPYALLCALERDLDESGGAICIDAGGGSTTVSLVRTQTKQVQSIPVGGVELTLKLAQRCGLSFLQAEKLKRDYAAGYVKPEQWSDIGEIFREECEKWTQDTATAIENLCTRQEVPTTFWLLGQAFSLPELYDAMTTFPWQRQLGLSQAPHIQRLELAKMLLPLRDSRGFLQHSGDALLMSLAYQFLTEDPTFVQKGIHRLSERFPSVF